MTGANRGPKNIGGPGQKRVRDMDRDGDGRVAVLEFEGSNKKFWKIDGDRDGYLTAAEFVTFLRKIGKIGGGPSAPAQVSRSSAPATAMRGPNGKTAAQIMRNSDQNRDGRLSRSEFRGKPKSFPRLDKNGDGFLTPAEIEARWRFLKRKRGG